MGRLEGWKAQGRGRKGGKRRSAALLEGLPGAPDPGPRSPSRPLTLRPKGGAGGAWGIAGEEPGALVARCGGGPRCAAGTGVVNFRNFAL